MSTPATKSPTFLPVGVEDRRALIAIDLGAESCRVSLLRWESVRSSLEPDTPHIELIHRFPNHTIETADGLHWDLAAILDGLHDGLRQCARIATEGIRSIAVDGWAVDYVRLDEIGQPVADPFCYRDERTIAAESTLNDRISAARMRELTGIQLLRINTAYQLFADDAALRALPWLNLPEYILHTLGARRVSERTNASHTQLLGLPSAGKAGEWCDEILRAVEVPRSAMPELVNPGTDIGRLTGPLASLPAFADTRLIAPCCHDTASAIAAVPDPAGDWAYISSGTWSLVGTLLREPNNSPGGRAENFTNLAGAEGSICFHKNVNGMWLLRQCMESWAAEGAHIDIASLVDAAEHIPALDYRLDVDDPDLLLAGRMPQRINAQLHRRNLPEFSTAPADAPALAAFLFRSLATRYAEVLSRVTEITGKQFRRLYIMGGGSQNDLLNRLTAAATGLTVARIGAECSTTGNFAVQLSTLEGGPVNKWAALLAKNMENHSR
jgi:rhamnulokinase